METKKNHYVLGIVVGVLLLLAGLSGIGISFVMIILVIGRGIGASSELNPGSSEYQEAVERYQNASAGLVASYILTPACIIAGIVLIIVFAVKQSKYKKSLNA